jgi:hypothetical protein
VRCANLRTRWFQRFARKEGIGDAVLLEAVARAEFVYGFAKSRRANIDDDEKEQFKEAAKHVLALTEKQLAELLKRGDFMEVKSE